MAKCFLRLSDFALVFYVLIADKVVPHIICGQVAKPGQFPYQVSIQERKLLTFNHSCGGSILTPLWVLTAAHCTDHPISAYRIVAGITNLNDQHAERQERALNKIVTHPDYIGEKDNYRNDISLVELDKALEFDRFVNKIELSPTEFDLQQWQAVIIGWGIISASFPQEHGTLVTLNISIVPPSTCKNRVPFIESQSQICTGSEKIEGVCRGGSGSPLIQNQKIIGIASYVVPYCGQIGVFTKASNYIDFIQKHVKN